MTNFVVAEQHDRSGVLLHVYGPYKDYSTAQRVANELNDIGDNSYCVAEILSLTAKWAENQ